MQFDAFITMVRQGRVYTATILEADSRVEGRYEQGDYSVRLPGDDSSFNRVASATESAGIPFRIQPKAEFDAPGNELRIDEFITLLRQGRIVTATVLAAHSRILGTDERGEYWVGYGGPLLLRLASAIEEAGVPLRVQPESQVETAGIELRIDQFITLLRQGRISTATDLTAHTRIIGTYDRGDYWVAYAHPLLERLEAALRSANVPVMRR